MTSRPHPPSSPRRVASSSVTSTSSSSSTTRGGTIEARTDASTGSISSTELDSDVEAELDDVAVGHDVVLALHAYFAGGLGRCHRAGGHEIVEGHDLGLDEAAFEVRVNHAGRLRRGCTLGDRPGAGLLGTGSEVRLQPQRVEADA